MTKLEQLRQLMVQHDIHTYIITKMDPHQSEYSHPRYNEVQFISGFSGSAGKIVVTANEAGLWTDSRYYLQANNELASGFTLHKEGEPDTIDFMQYAANVTKEEDNIGFCGESLSAVAVKKLATRKKKTCQIKYDKNLINEIWKDRPIFSRENIFVYDERYCGETHKAKVAAVREQMAKKNAPMYVISSLDDIAWLFNIRSIGSIGAFNFLAYAVVSEEETMLFMDTTSDDKEATDRLQKQEIKISPYNHVYDYIDESSGAVALSPGRSSYSLFSHLKGRKIVELAHDITATLKARKNSKEKENMRLANERDGVSFVRLIMWLKSAVSIGNVTEYDVTKKLEELRGQDENYMNPSFEPICGYGANGAIVHYKVSQKTAAHLQPKGFVLVDAGANYIEGTTDITRTIALGPLTEEMRRNYTAVLKANIALETLQFRHGAMGVHIDSIARSQMWKEGLHYGHGTGHGIGHLLNVHEGPQSVSEKLVNVVLEEDMLISNEPGVYIEGQYGIRLETSLFITESLTNVHGKFLKFENIVFVPFERKAIVRNMLTQQEIAWINDYHQKVYKKLAPHLSKVEAAWLKDATEAI
ncbi:MAG: M24 family metallopeptidase [Defluviitaleaceae bacterium]|nr:M24 family metallopeptidase [Defluviitaleaceae bacterium]